MIRCLCQCWPLFVFFVSIILGATMILQYIKEEHT